MEQEIDFVKLATNQEVRSDGWGFQNIRGRSHPDALAVGGDKGCCWQFEKMERAEQQNRQIESDSCFFLIIEIKIRYNRLLVQ